MRTVILFGVAGAAGFFVDLVVMLLLRSIGADYVFSRAISIIVAIATTWGINRTLAFRSHRRTNVAAEMGSYYVGNLAGASANYLLFQILVHRYGYLSENPWIALAAGACLGLFVNFNWAKYVTFRPAGQQWMLPRLSGTSAAFSIASASIVAFVIWGIQGTAHLGFGAPAEGLVNSINAGVSSLRHYPWTDMAENTIIGFNLANGHVFARDTVVTHMPLIYQYLQLWFEVFGIDEGTPSAELAAAAYSISALATVVVQVAFVTVGAWAFGLRRSSALVAAVYVGFCAVAYALSFPLSENIIPFIVFAQFAFLYAILARTADVKTQIIYGAWSLSALPLINLLAGLSIFLSVAFLWAIIAVICVNRFRTSEWRLQDIPWGLVATPVALSVLLLLYQVLTVDHYGMWFWNIEVNRNQLHDSNPVDTIKDAFLFHWRYLNQPHVIGGNIYELMVAASVAVGVAAFLKKPVGRIVVFVLIGFVFALLGQWRTNIGFKSELFHGFTWALAALCFAWLMDASRLRQHVFPKQFQMAAMILLLGFGAGIYVPTLGTVLAIDTYKDRLPPRPQPFDQAEICRFRQSTPCRCLQATSFGPQFFLEHDIRQCPDRFSTFATVLFRNEQVRQNLLSDLQDPGVAFLRFPIGMLEMAPENREPEAMERLYGAKSNCIPYAGDASLCFTQ